MGIHFEWRMASTVSFSESRTNATTPYCIRKKTLDWSSRIKSHPCFRYGWKTTPDLVVSFCQFIHVFLWADAVTTRPGSCPDASNGPILNGRAGEQLSHLLAQWFHIWHKLVNVMQVLRAMSKILGQRSRLVQRKLSQPVLRILHKKKTWSLFNSPGPCSAPCKLQTDNNWNVFIRFRVEWYTNELFATIFLSD